MKAALMLCVFLVGGVIHAAERDVAGLLTSIRISGVKCKDASLEEVLDYLNHKVKTAAAELNNQELNRLVFSSINEAQAKRIADPDGGDPKAPPAPRISINIKEILLGDLLKEVGRQSGLNVYITSEGVLFTTRKILKTVYEVP